jgi:hypothetical protein
MGEYNNLTIVNDPLKQQLTADYIPMLSQLGDSHLHTKDSGYGLGLEKNILSKKNRGQGMGCIWLNVGGLWPAALPSNTARFKCTKLMGNKSQDGEWTIIKHKQVRPEQAKNSLFSSIHILLYFRKIIILISC